MKKWSVIAIETQRKEAICYLDAKIKIVTTIEKIASSFYQTPLNDEMIRHCDWNTEERSNLLL